MKGGTTVAARVSPRNGNGGNTVTPSITHSSYAGTLTQ